MNGEIRSEAASGLERLCIASRRERIITGAAYPGLERIHAHFFGDFFSTHRHDTYALGLTLHGVQSFHYRGSKRASLPGQIIVLHPDEPHDGGAGTEHGLHYRMLYLEPTLLGAALESMPLPFVSDPVVTDPGLHAVLRRMLDGLDESPEELAVDAFVAEVAQHLHKHSGAISPPQRKLAQNRILRARDYLRDNTDRPVRSKELERVSGLSRYDLARQFRALFGTSPHRFSLMRRLGKGQAMISSGVSLADAAQSVGFADQSHFSRHFKKTFGMTPGIWRQLTREEEAA